MFQILIFIISLGARAIRTMCRRRADLVLENLALRQQVTALKKERRRPPLRDIDRAFWAALCQSWPLWASRLVIVKADTVARWHRDRFRRYWAKISQRRRPGRPRVDTEVRQLIRTMAQDGWGAPRIHAELMKRGFDVSEITVSRYLPRRPAEPDEVKRWVNFLRNHKHDIAAMDLFTVPTASLRLLYGFFVIKHGRRHIVHFNATFNPTASWVMQQLREAFPYDTALRYLNLYQLPDGRRGRRANPRRLRDELRAAHRDQNKMGSSEPVPNEQEHCDTGVRFFTETPLAGPPWITRGIFPCGPKNLAESAWLRAP